MKNTQNIEKSRKHFGENFMLLYLLVDYKCSPSILTGSPSILTDNIEVATLANL